MYSEILDAAFSSSVLWDLHVRQLDSPDLAGVLRDGLVAGELSGGGNVRDHHIGPLFGVLSGNRR